MCALQGGSVLGDWHRRQQQTGSKAAFRLKAILRLVVQHPERTPLGSARAWGAVCIESRRSEEARVQSRLQALCRRGLHSSPRFLEQTEHCWEVET